MLLDQRVHAQTTYNQENLAFCFQLCTVAHFVGLLLLPWFSSSLVFFPYSWFGGFFVICVLKCKTFKLIISKWLWRNERTCFSPTFPSPWMFVPHQLLFSYLTDIGQYTHDPELPQVAGTTELRPLLSGVHSVMRVKSVLAGEGGGCTPTPSHYIYPHQ